MTPDRSSWRRLQRLVTARVTEASSLTAEARLVLLGVVVILAGGGEIPARKRLAAQLGIGRHRLALAIGELVGNGLVRVEDGGSRADRYELDVDALEGWLCDRNRTTSDPKSVPLVVQDQHHKEPAASIQAAVAERAHAGAPARESREPGLEYQLRASERNLRDAGFRVTRATAAALEEWLRAGVPAHHIRSAAYEANRAGVRELNYLESILDRLQDEAAFQRGPRSIREGA